MRNVVGVLIRGDGVLSTRTSVIDGVVKVAGKVSRAEEINRWINEVSSSLPLMRDRGEDGWA
ncbi:MAG TPA: hypothetical protein VMV04_16280 [Thermodesulfobacteriota bacterium]|nr:hypothetical protein [Thermodesulfobacteriota bacterium]